MLRSHYPTRKLDGMRMRNEWKRPDKWGFRKLTVGKFDKRQVSGIAVSRSLSETLPFTIPQHLSEMAFFRHLTD